MLLNMTYRYGIFDCEGGEEAELWGMRTVHEMDKLRLDLYKPLHLCVEGLRSRAARGWASQQAAS